MVGFLKVIVIIKTWLYGPFLQLFFIYYNTILNKIKINYSFRKETAKMLVLERTVDSNISD